MKKHGMTGTPLYRRWSHMKERCNNANNIGYKDYGGRGITVCEEWENDFVAFYEWSMANGYSEELQLDRKDNDKGYSPENCRYVTPKQNYANKRDNTHVVINGIRKTIAEWARESNLSPSIIIYRLENSWSEDKLLIPAENGRTGEHRYRHVTINGETRHIREWARLAGIAHGTILHRLSRGLTGEALLAKIKSEGRTSPP